MAISMSVLFYETHTHTIYKSEKDSILHSISSSFAIPICNSLYTNIHRFYSSHHNTHEILVEKKKIEKKLECYKGSEKMRLKSIFMNTTDTQTHIYSFDSQAKACIILNIIICVYGSINKFRKKQPNSI